MGAASTTQTHRSTVPEDMKPLILPRLVAAKNSQTGSSTIDERVSTASADSTLSASKGPIPLSRMSFPHDHPKHSSSMSSAHWHPSHSSSTSLLSLLPLSSYEHVDSIASLSKLSRLAEDPIEEPFKPEVRTAEEDLVGIHGAWCLCIVTEGCPHCSSPIDDDSVVKPLLRHRGLRESSANSTGSRGSEWFLSLATRWRGRKTVSTRSKEDPGTLTPPSELSRWSSSLANSAPPHPVPPRSPNVSETELPAIPAWVSWAHEDSPTSDSPVDIATTVLAMEPIDRKAFASTPLLPPLIVDKQPPEEPTWQSPLQSPPVVDANGAFAAISNALGIPSASSAQTPTASPRGSLASLRYSGPNHVLLNPDIPRLADYDDQHDKWSVHLGHANFTIYPKPYMPEVCDGPACRELFDRWEKARSNYAKHQIRTGESFGVTSETYKLTEQKWSEIDAEWTRCHDMAVAHATEVIGVLPCAGPAVCRI